MILGVSETVVGHAQELIENTWLLPRRSRSPRPCTGSSACGCGGAGNATSPCRIATLCSRSLGAGTGMAVRPCACACAEPDSRSPGPSSRSRGSCKRPAHAHTRRRVRRSGHSVAVIGPPVSLRCVGAGGGATLRYRCCGMSTPDGNRRMALRGDSTMVTRPAAQRRSPMCGAILTVAGMAPLVARQVVHPVGGVVAARV